MSLVEKRSQDTPPGKEPAPPGKKWVKVTVVVDGHDREEWQLVDDAGGPAWPARSELRVLNRDLRRVESPEKVTGRAVYTHDVRLPGMLYARLLLCPHPAANCKWHETLLCGSCNHVESCVTPI